MKLLKMSLLVVAVVAVAIAPASSVAKGKYATDVTIKGPNGDFSGKVKSTADQCKAERTVKVMKKKPGKDDKIGTDTSEPNGDWSTGNSGENKGKFYAKAPAALGICEAGKSETIELD